MERFVIFLIEIKLYLAEKKDDLLFKWDNIVFFFIAIKDEIKRIYNKYCKNTVDKVIKYLDNFFFDLDESLTFLYNCIWYSSNGRFPGYIICALLSFVFMLLLGALVMAGLPEPLLLGCLVPISLVPIDIAVTMSLFIYKRFKRAYNGTIKRMKKEYGVRSSRELVEAYKAKKSLEDTLEQEKKKNIVKPEIKKTTIIEKNVTRDEQKISDSEFLEEMFGYVSLSKYVTEENREKFLNEINNVLSKYAQLKRKNSGDVNCYLRSDVEHLQSEYNRYVCNQERNNTNEDGYSMILRK